ncbi:MAG TPA: VOC family protein [Trebonia sp.]|jgi:catechol 2,3-dioxygenase-like lactoylglutathione lyase family enzyme
MPDSDLIPHRLGYVTIGVEDLGAAEAWWTRYAQLEVSERAEGRVHLRGGTDHHWIVLEQTAERTGVRQLAFEVTEPDDLERYEKLLAAEGVATERSEGEWTGPAIRFCDPNGYAIELFAGMGNVPVTPTVPWVPPRELLHAVVSVADLDKSYDFWHRIMGLRESDRVIGKTIFLRCGINWHHALVIGAGRGNPPFLDHVCFQMNDIDDLMRVRARFIEDKLEFDRDLLRHPTSGSMGFYTKAIPSPTTVEFCIGHARITDPDYRPRALTPGRWTSNVWLPPAGS